MSFAHFPVYAFIASSSEGLPVAEKAFAYLDKAKLDKQKLACVDIWDDLVPPGEFVIETLEQTAKRIDFAIFVLTPDDVLVSRNAKTLTVRDNVNFELGFFIAKLGRKRCLVLRPADVALKLCTDMAGITCVNYTLDPKHKYQSILRAPSQELVEHMKSVGPRGARGGFLNSWWYSLKRQEFSVSLDPDEVHPYAVREVFVVLVAFAGDPSAFLTAEPIDVSAPWEIPPHLLRHDIKMKVSCANLAKVVKKGDRVWGLIVLVPSGVSLARTKCVRDIVSLGGRIVSGAGNVAG